MYQLEETPVERTSSHPWTTKDLERYRGGSQYGRVHNARPLLNFIKLFIRTARKRQVFGKLRPWWATLPRDIRKKEENEIYSECTRVDGDDDGTLLAGSLSPASESSKVCHRGWY